MGLVFLAVAGFYLLGSIIALVVVRKVFKRWWPLLPVGLALALYPFWDYLVAKGLSGTTPAKARSRKSSVL